MPKDYYGVDNPLPDGLSEKDLAILYVGFLLFLGGQEASKYARSQDVAADLGFTLGVPAAFASSPEIRLLFAEIAKVARNLVCEPSSWAPAGCEISRARGLLAQAKERAAGSLRDDDHAQWIRNESVAALLWGFRSPNITDGLYSAIDVGAGTTNSSWFRIKSRPNQGVWEKDSFVFYGSACQPPGVDLLDRVLARRRNSSDDPSTLRDHEGEELTRVLWTSDPNLTATFHRIFHVHELAFQRAYLKDQRMGSWEPSSLLLFGGGSLIEPLAKRLEGPADKNLQTKPERKDPGVPRDLKEFDGKLLAAGHRVLLVAYGLSFPFGDVPEVCESGDVDEYKPERDPTVERLDTLNYAL